MRGSAGFMAAALVFGAASASAFAAEGRPSGPAATIAQRAMFRSGVSAPDGPRRSDVVVPASSERTLARAAAGPKTTRVLVILAYWSKPDSVTRAQAKSVVITQTDHWYDKASFGAQRITGAVTPWLKIPKRKCGDLDAALKAATAAARDAGYKPQNYQRKVVYEPCSEYPVAGRGYLGANGVVITSGGMELPVSVHEQGHNYGLQHANFLACHNDQVNTTLRGATECTPVEYEDLGSAMAKDWNAESAGEFTAPEKFRLGWLAGHLHTVTNSRWVTLSPYEVASKWDAVRVPGTAKRTYWLEYRTARDNDAHIPANWTGVLVHLSAQIKGYPVSLGESLLLDPLPYTADLQGDEPVYIPVGSSYTTPEGIRFTVRSASKTGARVSIARSTKTAKPGQVSDLSATADDGSVTLSFGRAPDNGTVVRGYLVSGGGQTQAVSDFTPASTLHLTMDGLTNGDAYTFSVRARNQDGTGAPVEVTATPNPPLPTVQFSSPSDGATVSGVVTLTASAQPNSQTQSPIEYLEFDADGQFVDAVDGASGSVQWDTTAWGSGDVDLTVVAYDALGNAASQSITVTVTAPNFGVRDPRQVK
jgi:hypothetical protein